MKKAMDEKLVVRPIVGSLMHTHFWEGPCRAGRREDMTTEAETAFADRAFETAKQTLQEITAKVELLPAVDARYYEDFVTPQSVFDSIDERIGEVDVFLTMNWRIPKLERYRKPVVILHNGNEGIDFAAYCKSIGVEAYVCLDMQDLDETLHLLWVRKAVAKTRALVLTAGSQPTFGIQSLIRDPELIRQKYGMEVIKLPYTSILPYMDAVTDERAKPIADKMIAGSGETKVNTDYFINDIKYYLAALGHDGALRLQCVFHNLPRAVHVRNPAEPKVYPLRMPQPDEGRRHSQRLRGRPQCAAGDEHPAIRGQPACVHGQSEL